jgi:hypothetical protein
MNKLHIPRVHTHINWTALCFWSAYLIGIWLGSKWLLSKLFEAQEIADGLRALIG